MDWDFHRKVITRSVRHFLAPDQRRRQKQLQRKSRLEAESRAQAFEKALTPDQLKLFGTARKSDDPEAVAAFVASLDEGQGERLRSVRLAYRWVEQPVGAVRFDLQLASRWIANRVVALGWNPQLFLEFDHFVRDLGRHLPGAERMSEKYQWIALYELLARLADHCDRHPWNGKPKRVAGLWELEERDIDPTYGSKAPEQGASLPSFRLLSDKIEEDDAWVRTLGDCAAVELLVDVEDSTGRRWLVLESYPEWNEEVSPEIDPWSVKRRRVWYHLRSYVLERADVDTFLRWARGQRLYGRWMPESHQWDRGFLGEYPWHPSTFEAQQDWTTRPDHSSGDLPVQLLGTGCLYSGTRDRDYSVIGYANGVLPNGPVLDGLQGKWAGAGLRYVNATGRLVAWDPSNGRDDAFPPSCLLVDPQALRMYLDEQELTIVWTVSGEKIVLPGGLDVPGRYVRGDISGSLYLDGDEVRLDSLRIYAGGGEESDDAVVVDSIGRA